MITIGIESSCDETSVAMYSSEKGVLSSETFSQNDIHAAFGGVIPEVASRSHIVKIRPLFDAALKNAGIEKRDIDLIGVTSAPGLIGALFVGVSFAKGLGFALKRPVVPVHHLSGHILSAELSHPGLEPPYTALVVSGGHTHIFDVDEALNFRLMGRTVDDAAGEAFDKTAKMMSGPYPGGKFIQELAEKGNPEAIKFPVAFKGEIKFSFSGLKTAVMNALAKNEFSREDIAASFQRTVADTLASKTFQAASLRGRDRIVVGGGVACNSEIRKAFSSLEGVRVYFPDFSLCTDNADMIAYAAYRFYGRRRFFGYSETAADTRHEI